MTKTWSKVCLGASLSFLLLSGCASGASDTNSGASSEDAGRSPDASTQSNELPDAADSSDAGSAANGGRGGAGTKGGSPAPGGAGGAGGRSTAGSPGTDEPEGGAGGAGNGNAGGDQAPPAAGSPSGAGGHSGGEDADAGTSTPPRDPNAICTACGACEETIPIVSAMHTNMPVTYPDPPPTSGPHNPCWAAWGIHDEPLAAERWVHNMEHGGIVLTYNCPDGCADEVAVLKNFVSTHTRTVLAAYDKLPARFAVTSWGHRLVSECLDEQALAAFYTAHFDRGPESNSNPPNPSCPP